MHYPVVFLVPRGPLGRGSYSRKGVFLPSRFLKFPTVTILGAQCAARLSEEICLSEGSAGVSQRALRGSLQGFCGVSARVLRGSAGVRGTFRRFFGGSDPMLVTLGNCWTGAFSKLPILDPLLRTLLRTLPPSKTPLQNTF